MSDHILQDYRGQTFDKAVAGYLRGKLLVSGFEPRTGAAFDRFWWGILENTDGTKTVACGRVSNFQDYGWGYKIEEASAWKPEEPNPPLNVRKAIVKHGLTVTGVYEPGVTTPEFATTMLKDLTANLLTSLKAGDEKYALDAIASLKHTVVTVIAEFIRGGEKVNYPESVLDACTDYLDAKSAGVFARFHRFESITLTSAQAVKVAPFLDKFDFADLQPEFPELLPTPAQEAYVLSVS